MDTKQVNDKLIQTKKDIENIVQKRYAATAQIEVCKTNINNVINEIKELNIDPHNIGEALANIDKEINENMEKLKSLDEVIAKYKEIDLSTVKDMKELEALNMNQDF